jgi:hypothetical protein
MTITELHQKLLGAYTPGNLNNISLTLINLYREQQYSILQRIGDIISDTVNIEITETGKGFSKFMMLYHPDRACFHLKEIERLASQNDLNGLMNYSHILLLSDIEEIARSLDDYEDIDYSPVYEWDFNVRKCSAYGFSIIDDDWPEVNFMRDSRSMNFYDALKIRIFENTDYEFPAYYLEGTDEFELSSDDISDLTGAEYCIYARHMDLSDNRISDLSPLFRLLRLENLNLSDNLIEYIDVLSNLINLRNLNLANNRIGDISPLFDLPKLQYVDLSGNGVCHSQVEILRDLGVEVDV